MKVDQKHVHCIGIGGIGVSALAELLLKKGYSVSGSDVKNNAQIDYLKQLGASVAIGHQASHVDGADWVIYSSAVCEDNPEYLAAKKRHLPLISRGAALAQLLESEQVISISGTHGKTTTTALMAYVLKQAGLEPSYVVGGIMQGDTSPAHIAEANGGYFVAEVDESDASFLYMQSLYAVITNIDVDHLEAYDGDFQRLQQGFLDYLAKVSPQGAAIVCVDDPVVAALLPKMPCRVITYGFSEKAQVRASHYQAQGLMSCFDLHLPNGECLPAALSLSGRHNVLNALASIAVAYELRLSMQQVSASLKHFPGVARRFHCHGNMSLPSGTALVVEDYGHHPAEIKVTLDAARSSFPDKRIVMVFQPHRYTRTRDLYQAFVSVLSEADELFLLDIYAASEAPIDGISSQQLAEDIFAKIARLPAHVSDLQSLPQMLYQQLQNADMLILQGAGSVGSIANDLLLL